MIATYRLQLTPEFGFDDVRALIPYFAQLGVSHLYLSPINEARLGSAHGYDVIDHNRLREAFGGDDAFDRLQQACLAAGLGLVLDFVPNHAGVGPRNLIWRDVLAYGPHSPHARFFDIDWMPFKQELTEKVLLAFLGRPYGEALDAGEISLVWENGYFLAAYFTHRFALTVRSYATILSAWLPALERTDRYFDVKEIIDTLQELLPAERERAEALRLRLETFVTPEEIAPVLSAFTGDPLHALLEQQYWRLSYWKTAGYEINYRRFFDINELVALRMEDTDVFFEAHRLLGHLLRSEAVTGVRIDHVDGLSDPHLYLQRLRELGAKQVWVEKILTPGEILPSDWPVSGTTGYDFLNDVIRLLIDPAGEGPLDQLYRRVVHEHLLFDETVYQSKRLVMATTLAGELFRLAYELDRLSEADYHTRDFTFEALREALAEISACFKRYRTYLPHDHENATAIIKEAVHTARQRNPAFEQSVYDFIMQVLLTPRSDALEPVRQAWVTRWQQYTAPLAAKGVEDTTYYRYVRFIALNEVGGHPDRFAAPPEVFHAHARFRAFTYPQTLLCTATHDHKRGEDLRMRLVTLSELHPIWTKSVHALQRAVRRHQGDHGPSAPATYLFLQTLVALWDKRDVPQLEQRLQAYMVKAAREAKVHTSWLSPNESYEADLEAFIAKMLRDKGVDRILQPLAQTVARHGFVHTISQLILKLTSPGIPDFYQGSELLDLSLVDPDNRQPVDFAQRRALIDALAPLLATPDAKQLEDWANAADVRLKLYTMVRLLRFRRTHLDLFAGSYRALECRGPAGDRLMAYERTTDDERLVVVLQRFLATTAADALAATHVTLEDGASWTDVLTDQAVTPSAAGLSVGHLALPWSVLYGKRPS